MTRHRTNFVRERATLANRVQKVRESANLKLASVASDVLRVSGRAMLAAIAAGEEDATRLAALAKGRLRKKREALEQALSGRVRPHHRFLLTELLVQIDGIEETIARFDAQVALACSVNDEDAIVELLDTIPGIARGTAELLVAEIGTDMSRQGHADAPGAERQPDRPHFPVLVYPSRAPSGGAARTGAITRGQSVPSRARATRSFARARRMRPFTVPSGRARRAAIASQVRSAS